MLIKMKNMDDWNLCNISISCASGIFKFGKFAISNIWCAGVNTNLGHFESKILVI